jgi:hypothetical protein
MAISDRLQDHSIYDRHIGLFPEFHGASHFIFFDENGAFVNNELNIEVFKSADERVFSFVFEVRIFVFFTICQVDEKFIAGDDPLVIRGIGGRIRPDFEFVAGVSFFAPGGADGGDKQDEEFGPQARRKSRLNKVMRVGNRVMFGF